MKLDDFDNRQHMQKWMVLPLAPDDVLSSFVHPFIITQMMRGHDQCTVFWYAGDYHMAEFRERADRWETEQRRKH